MHTHTYTASLLFHNSSWWSKMTIVFWWDLDMGNNK